MQLPFTLEQFLDVFRRYNESVGVAPIALTLLGATAVGLAWSRHAWRHRAIGAILALLSLWTGAEYHWGFFTRINPAAWFFGALFVAQAALLAVYGAMRGLLVFTTKRNGVSVVGQLVVLYALVVYPLLGWALGHGYPMGPVFGAPCPTTIFFFGMTLLAIESVPITVVLLPMVWAVIGTSAALQLGMREDLGLGLSAAIVAIELIRRRVWAMSRRSELKVAGAATRVF